MNVFFSKSDSAEVSKSFLEFKENDVLLVRYFDDFKNIHILEGKCVLKRKVVSGDNYISLYVKSKGFFFSFFEKSPLIISIFKKI